MSAIIWKRSVSLLLALVMLLGMLPVQVLATEESGEPTTEGKPLSILDDSYVDDCVAPHR